MQGSLFQSDAYGGNVPRADPCSDRHQGNQQSVDAYSGTTQQNRDLNRDRIIELCRKAGANGLTCEQAGRRDGDHCQRDLGAVL